MDQGRVAVGGVEDPAAVIGSRITAECGIYDRGRTVGIVDHPAAVRGRVAAEGGIQDDRTAFIVEHPAAELGRRIAMEGDVHHRRIAAGIVEHPAAGAGRRIAAENDVHHIRRCCCSCTSRPRSLAELPLNVTSVSIGLLPELYIPPPLGSLKGLARRHCP